MGGSTTTKVKWEDDIPPPRAEDEEEAPLPAQFSEDNLARHWVLRHGKYWRYVAQWGSWYEWQDDHWHEEKTSKVFELARHITREALLWDGLGKTERLRVNSARTAGAMLQFVRADRVVSAVVDQWDANRNLLGVPGGVVDLMSCRVLSASPEHFITKRTAVTPVKGTPERWTKFLKEVTRENEDVMAYLQRFAGYCLTGDTSEHALAFLYGTGANGKTTFVQTLLGIMGDYAITTPIETFAESRSDRHPTELARLRGARLVATEETSSGGRWNESRIKQLTGGNRISAHFMRQDDFEFQPEFKLLIAGNHKPQLRSVDEAMKRRMHIVPFTVTIPEAERDTHLQESLRKEWPQILNWMVQGCAAWRDYRLAPPEDVRLATELYLQANDLLSAWMDECCEREGETEGKVLYNNFAVWCDQQGETVWSRRAWSDALIDKGFEIYRRKVTGIVTRGFKGLKTRMTASPVKENRFND